MNATTESTEKLSYEQILHLFKETREQFRETREQFRETNKMLDERFKQSDERFKQTDKQFKETDRKLRKLEELFTSQWGKLIESLIEGDLLNLLNARGIKVGVIASRVKHYYNNRQYEFDLIAENGSEIVVVEVKTTLKPDDIKEFIEELDVIKKVLPKYKENNIYGAVAFLREDSNSSSMAERLGLYVIRATGKSADIINSPNFIPKAW